MRGQPLCHHGYFIKLLSLQAHTHAYTHKVRVPASGCHCDESQQSIISTEHTHTHTHTPINKQSDKNKNSHLEMSRQDDNDDLVAKLGYGATKTIPVDKILGGKCVANGYGVTFIRFSNWLGPQLTASANKATRLKRLSLQMCGTFSVTYWEQVLSSIHVYLMSCGGMDSVWKQHPTEGRIWFVTVTKQAAKLSSVFFMLWSKCD